MTTRKQLVGQIQRPGQRPEDVTIIAQERPVLTDAEQAAGIEWVDGRYAEGDVRRYGAVGDGTTDDTTAIQNAFDVAEQGNIEVKFPAGDFKTTATIDVSYTSGKDSAIRVRGIPYRTTIEPVISSGYAFVFDGGTTGNVPIILDGLTINGTNSTSTASGVVFNRTQSSQISNLYVYSFPTNGVRISENWNMQFFNLEIRESGNIGLVIENDTGYHTTTGEVNNIQFFGGTSSGNDVGVQIMSSGGGNRGENISFYGFNTSNDTRGWLVYNLDESTFDTIYLEQIGATATDQMYFKDCQAITVNSPHITSELNAIKVEDSEKIMFNSMKSDASLGASDTLFEVIDSDVLIQNSYFGSGGSGTFLTYEQTGTNSVLVTLNQVRIGGFGSVLSETINDGSRCRFGVYDCEGIDPGDFSTSARPHGIDRDGYVYLGPAGNKVAKLGNSGTTGATESGWITVDIEGTTAYVRCYATK